ncbi:hypothetical protein DUNSADRAFT_13800 [Dunaliella salina]|uniref:MSP domain-containing protein n=1 Tax=Dunaliella salina TaxID=3046 RepID=A0ABQ7G8N9_DUNSA|nr:hypothetical protein DUNSADRAFT_13800 [Dunaliella salina]|eukprot:KAF5830969.1 hypothetical protein DUNSADRAFT_13800 [Dunaliella salina]
MGDFYTVPDAINFRNISTLGKNQSRTLLLKNLTCTDVVVFLNLPFTKQFSLECDSSIQHEQLNNATCVITRVPAGGTGKVEVRLHTPPDPKDAENLQDCLVVVMGNVPLLVPIRAVWQPLEPASGQCLQAILSQMNFYPAQKEIDEHCNAFMVELASKLQISLQPPRAQSQLSQHRSFDGQACSSGQAHSDWKAHTHKEAGAVDGRHSNSGAGV